jgi:hypothetical protein
VSRARKGTAWVLFRGESLRVAVAVAADQLDEGRPAGVTGERHRDRRRTKGPDGGRGDDRQIQRPQGPAQPRISQRQSQRDRAHRSRDPGDPVAAVSAPRDLVSPGERERRQHSATVRGRQRSRAARLVGMNAMGAPSPRCRWRSGARKGRASMRVVPTTLPWRSAPRRTSDSSTRSRLSTKSVPAGVVMRSSMVSGRPASGPRASAADRGACGRGE